MIKCLSTLSMCGATVDTPIEGGGIHTIRAKLKTGSSSSSGTWDTQIGVLSDSERWKIGTIHNQDKSAYYFSSSLAFSRGFSKLDGSSKSYKPLYSGLESILRITVD